MKSVGKKPSPEAAGSNSRSKDFDELNHHEWQKQLQNQNESPEKKAFNI